MGTAGETHSPSAQNHSHLRVARSVLPSPLVGLARTSSYRPLLPPPSALRRALGGARPVNRECLLSFPVVHPPARAATATPGTQSLSRRKGRKLPLRVKGLPLRLESLRSQLQSTAETAHRSHTRPSGSTDAVVTVAQMLLHCRRPTCGCIKKTHRLFAGWSPHGCEEKRGQDVPGTEWKLGISMLSEISQGDEQHVFSLTYVGSAFKLIRVGMEGVVCGCVCKYGAHV